MSQSTEPVAYSDLRRPSTPGIWGLSTVQSALLLASALPLIGFAALGQILLMGAWILLVAVLALPLFFPARDGRNFYQRRVARMVFKRSKRRRLNEYAAGPTGHVLDGKCRLPGLHAESELLDARDAYGQPFAVLHLPSHHHYSVVIDAAADGDELTDQATINSQVAHWGAWLANLANHPEIIGASVTVETAPDSGVRFRRNLVSQTSENTPGFADAVIQEIARTGPVGSAEITTRLTLTFTGKVEGSVRPTEDVIQEIGNLLPTLVGSLALTGAGTTCRALNAQDVIDSTRVAFDPSVALLVEQARSEGGTGLTWNEAGPVGHDAEWDYYRHDRAWSKTWQMSEAPRGIFYASSLQRLLRPHRDIARKRVTILYRPQSPLQTARAVESDVKSTRWTASQRNSARMQSDVHAAQRAAEQEAQGAGLVRFGIVVTATVLAEDDLPLAERAIESLSAPARLRMREALGNQDAAFASGLPLGLVLQHHLALPPALQDSI